jgi:Mitochondrial protein Pet127
VSVLYSVLNYLLILSSPGVYFFQDPNSNVYNFDPRLEKIVPAADFDFSALPSYQTSSEDQSLLKAMQENQSRYSGSTSSLTGLLQHLHLLISDWRPLDCSFVSLRFGEIKSDPTVAHKLPVAVFLHPQEQGGYAIDKDDQMGGARELMFIGHLLEKLLTVEKPIFDRYLRTHENPIVNDDNTGNVYNYTAFGPIMVRSQLDTYDPRLRGSGIVDVKTRACVGVRMDFEERHDTMKHYEIRGNLGTWESYERERYDLIRTMMMKYSLQVRLGRMSGVFVAYHNVRRLFGFEYIPLSEMDMSLHGQTSPELGDMELRFSMALLNIILSKVEEKFPGKVSLLVNSSSLIWSDKFVACLASI